MSRGSVLRIETLEPSEKLIEVASTMKKILGVKARTSVREGTSSLIVEVSGIKNEEFGQLISRALSRVRPFSREDLSRIVEVTRWMDPVLSGCKDKYYGEPPQRARSKFVAS